MSNARRRALFKWYQQELGFTPQEARKARNRSRGWYNDFQTARRQNRDIKPPRWTPDSREQTLRFRALRRQGVPTETARKLRKLPAIRYEGARRSLKGTLERFAEVRGRRAAKTALENAMRNVTKYNEFQRAIDALYAQFRPERARGSRAERAGRRQGRIR